MLGVDYQMKILFSLVYYYYKMCYNDKMLEEWVFWRGFYFFFLSSTPCKNLQKFCINYTDLQGFVVEKLWVVTGVIFDVESESGIIISLSREDFEIFEVMCSKNGVFRYFSKFFSVLKNILPSKNIIYFSYFTNLNNYTKPERPSTFLKIIIPVTPKIIN